MRLLVIRIDGVTCEQLLDAERLTAVARLMEAGWHGPVTGGAWLSLAAEVTRQGRRSAALTPGAAEDLGAAFGRLRENLGPGGFDHVEISLAARGDGLAAFDAHLGETLESLDGETAVLVISPGAGFVLAAPAGGAGARRETTSVADLTRTLLEIGGYEVAPDAPGTTLAGAAAPPTSAEEEERLMRDHLRGLGYL